MAQRQGRRLPCLRQHRIFVCHTHRLCQGIDDSGGVEYWHQFGYFWIHFCLVSIPGRLQLLLGHWFAFGCQYGWHYSIDLNDANVLASLTSSALVRATS